MLISSTPSVYSDALSGQKRRQLRVVASGLNQALFSPIPLVDLRELMRLNGMKQIVSVGLEYVRYVASVASDPKSLQNKFEAIMLRSETRTRRALIGGATYVGVDGGVNVFDVYATSVPVVLYSQGLFELDHLYTSTSANTGQTLTLDSVIFNVFDYYSGE